MTIRSLRLINCLARKAGHWSDRKLGWISETAFRLEYERGLKLRNINSYSTVVDETSQNQKIRGVFPRLARFGYIEIGISSGGGVNERTKT